MTVRELLVFAVREFSNGNADKQIYISRDDEGNGFHPLVYGFTTDEEEVNEIMSSTRSYITDVNNIVLLG